MTSIFNYSMRRVDIYPSLFVFEICMETRELAILIAIYFYSWVCNDISELDFNLQVVLGIFLLCLSDGHTTVSRFNCVKESVVTVSGLGASVSSLKTTSTKSEFIIAANFLLALY